MNIITEKTQLQQDLDRKDALVLSSAQATLRFANHLNNNETTFWQLPTNRLLAVLNHNVDVSLATLSLNAQLHGALTASLAALGTEYINNIDSSEKRDDIIFDGSQFVLAETPLEP